MIFKGAGGPIFGIEDYLAASCRVIFPVRNFNRSIIRSLTPQQAAGNALAIADQSRLSPTPKVWVPIIPNIGPRCALGIDHPHTGFQKKT